MLRRLVSFVLLLAIAGALLVAAFPQVANLQQHYYVAQIVAFRGVLVLVAVVAAVVLLLVSLAARFVRGFLVGFAVLLLVFAVVDAGVLLTRGTGSTSFKVAASTASPDIRVLSWNTRGGAPGAKAIAQLALTTKATVVSLPETTKATADEVAALMKAGGVTMSVFTLAYDQVSPANSTSLLISSTLGTYKASSDETTTAILPTVIARPTTGDGPTIVAAHPVAPLKAHMNAWRKDLSYLAGLCAGGTGDSVIMAGDFNSTIDHLSGLGATPSATLGSCRDAAEATGNAAVGTWPTDVPALLATPIDHVMTTSDWRVTGFKVIRSEDGAGSDHRPILAQLTSKAG